MRSTAGPAFPAFPHPCSWSPYPGMLHRVRAGDWQGRGSSAHAVHSQGRAAPFSDRAQSISSPVPASREGNALLATITPGQTLPSSTFYRLERLARGRARLSIAPPPYPPTVRTQPFPETLHDARAQLHTPTPNAMDLSVGCDHPVRVAGMCAICGLAVDDE